MKRARFTPKTPSRNKAVKKEPIHVYCRLRPMVDPSEVSCMKVIGSNIIQMTTPSNMANTRVGCYKEIQYVFKRVFEEHISQKEVFDDVAFPLIEGLLQGRSSLLFAYGITGSGKTYTMSGTPQDGGIMPRTLDCIFNSISGFQAKKYVFKPDRLNGFEVQTEAEAKADCVSELHRNIQTLQKKDSNPELINQRIPESSKVPNIVEDNVYAAFISYIEIYNNYIYDLLEDPVEESGRIKSLQSKILREDGSHNMYVHCVTEVEVKSAEEAFEVLYKGQKKKRMAESTLNVESSRSHSIFTIRLVQAPLDTMGENIVNDKKAVTVSQLSLVDLAGSERTNRTKNSGERLREAGNINNSLMTLRLCLEILRENQLKGANKIVPYRDSRLTQLFKQFFEGGGEIRMIICANPRSDEYDENTNVMKFAEMSQEVQVAIPTPYRKLDLGLTPGRRRANQLFKDNIAKIVDFNGDGDAQSMPLETAVNIFHRFKLEFPNVDTTSASDDETIRRIMLSLEESLGTKNNFKTELQEKTNCFRELLIEQDKELHMLRHENSMIHTDMKMYKSKVLDLERNVESADKRAHALQLRLAQYEHQIPKLHEEIAEKEMAITKRNLDREKEKIRLQNKIAQTAEKVSREVEQKFKEQNYRLQKEVRDKDRKLKQMREIFSDDYPGLPSQPPTSPKSTYSCRVIRTGSADSIQVPTSSSSAPATALASATPSGPVTTSLPATVTPSASDSAVKRKPHTVTPGVSNRRHRRSRSVSDDMWLEHRPTQVVPLGTVLQPVLKKRKSVTKLTDVKDIVNNKTSKYCLMTQNQDSDGDLETCFYKGDVVPTCGGGAQVIFNDVETLKQKSPQSSPTRKRNAENIPPDVLERKCAIGIEGHSKRQKT